MKKTKDVVPFCLFRSPYWLLCIAFSLVDAQDDAGTRFIAQKEEHVKQIAIGAGMLDSNCTLLANCDAECSRAVCSPLKADLQADCVHVEINDFCQPTKSNQTCNKYMKLNYQRSYLTLSPPGTPDQSRSEVTRDICHQRALDETFMKISSKTEFSYVYFGSASGVLRAFPGRERPAGNDKAGTCGNYQLYRRPWFKNAVSVQKQLKIVVDTGNSMGKNLPPNYPPGAGSTLLEVTSNIILKMLKTVSPDDFVDVATFNSSGYYPLNSQVQVSSRFDETEDSTELAALEASVKNSLTRSSPGLSNLTAAIVNAVDTFRDAPADTLKVIVIFTDGQFSPLDSTMFPTARILALPVKVIIYKFPLSGETDPFLNTTTLPNVLCGVKGTFELLDAVHSVRNPLYAIRSFYTFMARTQLAVAKNQSTWTARYLGYSQPLNGTSATYPAFGSDGQLIGVAGIDIYPEELNGTIRDLVYRALETRTAKGNMPAPAASINLVCSYQTALRSEKCSGSAASSLASGGICSATDSGRELQERVCCDSCLAATHTGSKDKMVLTISLSTVLPALAILVVCCICCYMLRNPPVDESFPEFMGPPADGHEETPPERDVQRLRPLAGN